MGISKHFALTSRLAFLLAGLSLAASGSVLAAHPFELDGNAVAEPTVDGTDWDNVFSGTDTVPATTGLKSDRPEPTAAIYNGGGSKDQGDIPGFKWRSGSPPDKDDLTHAYAAAVNDDNATKDFVLAFGMDRFDTSGDAQLGFWFFQDTVAPLANGTFSGKHVDGDLLVLVNFSNGGVVPTIQIFKWVGGGVVQIGAPDASLCTGGWIPSGKDHCGVTNAGKIAAPWSYVNKDVGATNQFPAGAFFEGAINLTKLNATACFTSFVAESRSSTSITAVLKDFVSAGFPVCSVSVSKECKNPRLNAAQDKIIYDITGKVTNEGFGQLYGVALADAPAADGAFKRVDCNSPFTVLGSFPLASALAGGAQACYSNTITVPLSENGSGDTVTVTSNTKADGTGTNITDTGSATCPNFAVNASLSVEKDCNTTVEVTSNLVAALVNVSGKVCNTGDSRLTNVKVEDLGIDTEPNPLVSGLTLEAGACENFAGTYFPGAAKDSTGVDTQCPGKVVFKDTVKATAINIFGGGVPNKNKKDAQGNPAPEPDVTDSAECPLCDGDCSSTP